MCPPPPIIEFATPLAEVNSVYFLSLVSLECFLAFIPFYSSSIINSTPGFVLKNIAFGPCSRYCKILPAAVANQIARFSREMACLPSRKNLANESLRNCDVRWSYTKFFYKIVNFAKFEKC